MSNTPNKRVPRIDLHGYLHIVPVDNIATIIHESIRSISTDHFSYVFLQPATPASAYNSPTRSQSSSPRRSTTRSPIHSEASRKRKRGDGSAVSTNFATSIREMTKHFFADNASIVRSSPGPTRPWTICHVIPKKSANVGASYIFFLIHPV